jgi:hypothetical protein
MTLDSDGAAAIKDTVRRDFSGVNDERCNDVLPLYHRDATLDVAARGPKIARDRIRPIYDGIGTFFTKHVAEIRLVLTAGSPQSGSPRRLSMGRPQPGERTDRFRGRSQCRRGGGE